MTQPYKVCPHCGQPLATYMIHCGRCGQAQPGMQPAQNHRIHLPVIIGEIVALVLITFCLLFPRFQSSSGSGNTFRLVQINASQCDYTWRTYFWNLDGNQEFYRVHMTYADGRREVEELAYNNSDSTGYMWVPSDHSPAPRRIPASGPEQAVQSYMDMQTSAPTSETGPPLRLQQ